MNKNIKTGDKRESKNFKKGIWNQNKSAFDHAGF